MLIALGIALIPVALVATGLFLSGYQPQDFNVGLRYGLLALWLLYVFSADRIAALGVWRRVPLLRRANPGEVITVIAFAALIATMRLDTGAVPHRVMLDWLVGFGIMAALFLALYALFRAVSRSWRRARSRARGRARPRPSSG